jgi:hypothetical protein
MRAELLDAQADAMSLFAPELVSTAMAQRSQAMKSLLFAGACLLAGALVAGPASAHDYWANGVKVPGWVKSQCCGPNDVHHLNPGAVHIMHDGYHIDGLKTVVPISRALPSPDGTYWAFWNPTNEPEPVIFCFFAPVNGV